MLDKFFLISFMVSCLTYSLPYLRLKSLKLLFASFLLAAVLQYGHLCLVWGVGRGVHSLVSASVASGSPASLFSRSNDSNAAMLRNSVLTEGVVDRSHLHKSSSAASSASSKPSTSNKKNQKDAMKPGEAAITEEESFGMFVMSQVSLPTTMGITLLLTVIVKIFTALTWASSILLPVVRRLAQVDETDGSNGSACGATLYYNPRTLEPIVVPPFKLRHHEL